MSQSLFERIAGGDPAAMDHCLEEFGSLVWGLACRLSPTPAHAEEAALEIFTDIWSCASQYDSSQGSEGMFIAMTARRRLLDRRHKMGGEPLTLPAEIPQLLSQTHGLGAHPMPLEARQAAGVIAQLLPEQRRVLELSLHHGWSQSQIADGLKLPLGTVKTFIRRGLISVRQNMVSTAESLPPAVDS